MRPLDLVEAYGTIANDGVHEPARMILEIQDQNGKVVYRAPDAGKRALSATAAYQVTDILKGNTNPAVNEIWADKLAIRNGPHGERRPAAAKTGTADDARDLSTYGYLAPPAEPQGARAAPSACGSGTATTPCRGRRTRRSRSPRPRRCGGRSSASSPTASRWPTSSQPKGLVRTRIDAWSGGAPGPWTRETTHRAVPGRHAARREERDRPARAAVQRVVRHLGRRPGQGRARAALPGTPTSTRWLARARRGVGVMGLDGLAHRVLLGPLRMGRPAGRRVTSSRARTTATIMGTGTATAHGPRPGHGPPGGPPGQQPPGGPPKP